MTDNIGGKLINDITCEGAGVHDQPLKFNNELA